MTLKKSVMILLLALPLFSWADDFLNIQTDPFMIVGSQYVDLAVDMKLNNHWAVGPYARSATDQPLFDVGIRATYFEQQTYQPGWVTGFEVAYSQDVYDGRYYDAEKGSYCAWEVDQEQCGLNAQGAVRTRIDHGYFWRWKTFNVSLGLGAALLFKVDDPADVALLPAIHFAIGWVR